MKEVIQCPCSGNDAYCGDCYGVGTVLIPDAPCSIQSLPTTLEYDWAFCGQCVGYTNGIAGQCDTCGCWYQ